MFRYQRIKQKRLPSLISRLNHNVFDRRLGRKHEIERDIRMQY